MENNYKENNNDNVLYPIQEDIKLMENNYRDNYYGSILDPIHGDIKLSEIEKWCISHPLFSRLRKVKQNTFLYYVFPSANHTRFEHSIGVMHIAGKIFDACKENFATGEKKKEKYLDKSPSSFFDLRNLGDKEEIYYQELRLAALLHDIGHGPLSHLFDDFLMSKENFLKLIDDDILLKKYYKSFEIICPKDKIEHEHISCVFVFLILNSLKEELVTNKEKFSPSAKKVLDKISIERVIKLIEPDFDLKDDFIDDQGNNYSTFFSRIITAFPIDSDRMDYLLRDSYFSGVNYGFYDINRIFASFMATENNDKIYLTFKESGLDSILRFIQSRTHLYNQVYFHKTNRAANTMLSAATRTNHGVKKLLDQYSTVDEIANFYVLNSDEHFISHTTKEDICNDANEKLILQDLKSRKLFKRVYEHKIVYIPSNTDRKKDIEAFENKIKIIENEIKAKLKSLEKVGIFGYLDKYKNDTFKDCDEKVIKIALKDKVSGKYEAFENWNTLNREFINSDMLVIMVRVYLRRTFNNSNDFKLFKKRILNEIEEQTKQLETIK